jgi:hypothetical protein
MIPTVDACSRCVVGRHVMCDLSAELWLLQVLESVNGTLAQQYPHSIQYAPEDDDTGTAPAAAASGGSDCPFWLVKFDMAESRFMVDKYNVQALPCFLAFSSGKLVYAGLMVGTCWAFSLVSRFRFLCRPGRKRESSDRSL